MLLERLEVIGILEGIEVVEGIERFERPECRSWAFGCFYQFFCL